MTASGWGAVAGALVSGTRASTPSTAAGVSFAGGSTAVCDGAVCAFGWGVKPLRAGLLSGTTAIGPTRTLDITAQSVSQGPAPGSNFLYSGWVTESNHLGNVAYRTGKKLDWDGKNMKVYVMDRASLEILTTDGLKDFLRRFGGSAGMRQGWTDILSTMERSLDRLQDHAGRYRRNRGGRDNIR